MGSPLTVEQKWESLLSVFDGVGFILNSNGDCLEVISFPDTELYPDTDPEMIVGEPFRNALPDEVAAEFHSLVDRTLETGDTQTVEYSMAVQEEERWFEADVSPIQSSAPDEEFVLWFMRDITDRKEREREFADERDRIRAIVDAIPDIAIVYDSDGRYREVLTGQEELLIDDTEKLIGSKIEEILDPDVAETILEGIADCLSTDSVQNVEYSLELDGEKTWFEGRIAPLHTENKKEVVFVARDVTERRKTEKLLKAQNERLNRFANVLSHDLRNPLFVLQGHLELAQDKYESNHFEVMEDALDRMENLIDNMLFLAQEGQTIDETEIVDIRTAAEQSWELIHGPDAELRIEGDYQLEADPCRLRQLLENLFRNAVEHGGNTVTIRIGPLKSTEGFFVEDDGAGIPESERERIFDSGFTTMENGTGLGLAIVREIVETHGWDVQVTDGSAGGARFEITNTNP